jgi:hypothetical protein
MCFMNIQIGCQVAILDPIQKSMTSGERVPKSVLIIYLKPQKSYFHSLWAREENVIFGHSKWLPGSHLRSNHKIDDTRWKSAKKCSNTAL